MVVLEIHPRKSKITSSTSNTIIKVLWGDGEDYTMDIHILFPTLLIVAYIDYEIRITDRSLVPQNYTIPLELVWRQNWTCVVIMSLSYCMCSSMCHMTFSLVAT